MRTGATLPAADDSNTSTNVRVMRKNSKVGELLRSIFIRELDEFTRILDHGLQG